MNIRPKVRNAALVAALAAVGATAWATNDSMSYSSYAPASTVAAEEAALPPTNTIAVSDTLAPTETVVTTTETVVTTRTSEPKAIPVVDQSVSQPGITVESQRLSNDERIQAQVMDKLAGNPYLSGKIGVESNDAVVRLSGWTTTAGMAYRAQRDAGSIVGVRYIQNEIRPRIGGSV